MNKKKRKKENVKERRKKGRKKENIHKRKKERKKEKCKRKEERKLRRKERKKENEQERKKENVKERKKERKDVFSRKCEMNWNDSSKKKKSRIPRSKRDIFRTLGRHELFQNGDLLRRWNIRIQN